MKRSKGIALSYVYMVINTVIGLFMSSFVLRVLGKTEYGLYQTIAAFAAYLVLFEFGTAAIFTRNIALCKKDGTDDNEIQKNISSVWAVVLVLAAIIMLVSVVFYFSIDNIYVNSLSQEQIVYGKKIFIFVTINLVFKYFTQSLNGIILGFEEYGLSNIVSIIHIVARTGILVVFLLFIPKALTIVVIDTLISFLVLLVTFLYCKIKLHVNFTVKSFDKSIFISILPLAFAMFLQTIVNMSNNNVDKFVISIIMTPDDVAIYSIAMYIYITFSSLICVPISMYMPQVAKNMRDGKSGFELTKTLVQPCRLIMIIGSIILFGFIAVGRPFTSLVYGDEYMLAWKIAVIIMVPTLINMSTGVVINVLDVLRKRHVRSLILMGTTLSNILLTIWWVRLWGMIGAAIATAVCTIIGQVLVTDYYYSKAIKIKITYLLKEVFKGIIPSGIIACVAGGLVSFFVKNDFWALFLGGGIFVIVILLCFMLFGANDFEKSFILKKLKK